MEQKNKTFSVLFWIRKGRTTDKVAPLFCRITIQGQRYEISLNCKIKPQNWSAGAQKSIGKTAADKDANTIIDDTRLKVEETVSRILAKGYELNIPNFRTLYQAKDLEYSTISRIFDYHEIIDRKNLRPGSYQGYIITKKHLLDFIRIRYHVTDYKLEAIDKAFVTEFFAYLQGYNRPGTIRCKVNGALKHITRFKRVMNLAVQNEWINRNPVCLVRFKKTKVEKGFLTKQEIKLLEEAVLPTHLAIIRDIFIFSIYTGAAYIDIAQLTTSNLQTGIDGSAWLEYNRQKTDQRVALPLLQPAQKILQRYAAYHSGPGTHSLFPVPPNQVVNRYLKKIAQAAGITKNVTFHMARHTFATTVTLSNGIPIETVSRMLGHASLSTTQIYAKIVDKKVMDDMKGLRNLYAEKHSDARKEIINE